MLFYKLNKDLRVKNAIFQQMVHIPVLRELGDLKEQDNLYKQVDVLYHSLRRRLELLQQPSTTPPFTAIHPDTSKQLDRARFCRPVGGWFRWVKFNSAGRVDKDLTSTCKGRICPYCYARRMEPALDLMLGWTAPLIHTATLSLTCSADSAAKARTELTKEQNRIKGYLQNQGITDWVLTQRLSAKHFEGVGWTWRMHLAAAMPLYEPRPKPIQLTERGGFRPDEASQMTKPVTPLLVYDFARFNMAYWTMQLNAKFTPQLHDYLRAIKGQQEINTRSSASVSSDEDTSTILTRRNSSNPTVLT